ncbi:MAG: acyl-ACP--UDP-N-acetylglucosamine O-acyltransferase [Proteobacteria bacterium]|nr:acyl-ACP--UDP-N-acetylglucosamine O-acyltransferase [Desulfobacterales bacterium]MBL7102292.1 acyl-ACP--UDP-N-acetylglucosamine O-acyltransferase [Desulfobacteraceae bacterium]MBU0735436.1 acyl-ACP--UDP-N-acetylglucosamine O-acyltransferase [Pseudomonadota bacterium]MBL7171554.1 acyl-ACP--UDP-N-acetylglucosamine O-acyltransferase [Desulfobacteraceae bacterium]MBU0990077.1 acyl-ACP--UDP-N-acetylglucosamine O-acyltransferase [Pseudomonadota bacterium]
MTNDTATEIHPTAMIHPGAELADGVKIGPYSTVGEDVIIGRNTEIGAHVVIEGHTRIGERNRIYPFSSIGTPPQDIGYQNEDTRLIMGDNNIVREYVTVNRATTKEGWETVIGNNTYLMAYAHVAHDCHLSDWVILTNGATLGGHTHIGEYAILGAFLAVQQFVRIGAHAYLGAKSGIDRDVPPFMITAGPRAKLYGINQKGMIRRGFSQETINVLKKAYRIIWRENRNFRDGIAQVKKELQLIPELEMLLDFLGDSKRGVLR